MNEENPAVKLMTDYDKVPEDKQSGVIAITAINVDTATEEKGRTEVVICMEGNARLLMKLLCNAQKQLLKKYDDDEEFKQLGRKYITPILEGLTSDEQKALMQAIRSRLDTQKRPPLWDLVGHLRRLLG